MRKEFLSKNMKIIECMKKLIECIEKPERPDKKDNPDFKKKFIEI